MAPSRAASGGAAVDNYKLGVSQYKHEQWAEAVRSFNRVISFNITWAEAYEYKAMTLLKQFLHEAREYERSGAGPDGSACYDTAHKTATKAVEKFGAQRWQPFYVLADIVYRKQQYAKAQSYLSQVESHPSFRLAVPKQRASVRRYLERVANDRQHLGTRNAGRAEAEAIERDLEREERIRRRTNYEHKLTSDIYLRIFEVGRDADPRLAVRMSGVCRRWREVLVSQRGVWQRMVLGKGTNVLSKVKAYLERCQGRDGAEGSGLKELVITAGFDWGKAEAVGKLLKSQAPYIECLRVEIRSGDILTLLRHFRRSMTNLRVLDIRGPGMFGLPFNTISTPRLDFDILPLASSRLEELSFGGITFRSDRYLPGTLGVQAASDAIPWVEDPAAQLANVTSIRFTQSAFVASRAEAGCLLQYMPYLKEVCIDRVTCTAQALWGSKEGVPDDALYLEGLERWSVLHSPDQRDILPDFVIPSNLAHLEYEVDFPFDPITTFRADNLREAIPKLRSLSLAKTAVPAGFIGVLQDMTSLEFLNLSRCSLSPKFLEDLAKGANNSPRLLPNLVAISLAGNLELRAPVLRDFVNSRLPEAERIPIPVAPATNKRKNPFGPTRSKSIVVSSNPSQSTLIAPPPTFATIPPPPAKLRWLNVDLCESVDAALFPSLERKLGFVSRSMSVGDEDRIRGKGRWDWELDLGAECRWRLRGEGGEEEKCEVRSNGKGKYHVYHVCCHAQIAEEPEEKGWEWTSQIQRSQQSASQARRGRGRVGGTRQGRLSALQDE